MDIDDVLFAGILVAGAEAAEGVDDDGAGWVELTFFLHPFVEEVEVGAGVAAAVEPDPCGGVGGGGVVWDFEGERLGGSVDGAIVAARDEAFGGEPWGCAAAEGGDAGSGLGEEAACLGGVVWFEEFAEVEGVADGFKEDFGVGVGGFAGEALEVCGEGGQFCGKGGAVCLREFAADGRDEPF